MKSIILLPKNSAEKNILKIIGWFMNNLRFVITRSAMTNGILYPLCRYATTLPQRGGRRLTLPILNSSSNYGIATSALPPRDDNNSLLASDARGLKAGVGEVVSKFDKHLGGCDGVVHGAVGVV